MEAHIVHITKTETSGNELLCFVSRNRESEMNWYDFYLDGNENLWFLPRCLPQKPGALISRTIGRCLGYESFTWLAVRTQSEEVGHCGHNQVISPFLIPPFTCFLDLMKWVFPLPYSSTTPVCLEPSKHGPKLWARVNLSFTFWCRVLCLSTKESDQDIYSVSGTILANSLLSSSFSCDRKKEGRRRCTWRWEGSSICTRKSN